MADFRAWPAVDPAGLLRQWSDAQLGALGALDHPVAAAARTGSLLCDPATEAEVVEAEQRLGVKFPPSYREFLLLSNGAYGDTIGAVLDTDPRSVTCDGALGFLPVVEVRRFVEVEPETVEIWGHEEVIEEEVSAGPDRTLPFERNEVRDHRPIRDALLIARGFDANCSLLVPGGSARSGDEWEVWDHHREGSTRWSSFGAYLRDTVEHHLGVDVDEVEVLLLLAEAEKGDPRAAQRLSRVRSPQATELLLDAARRGVVPHAVMAALARIGGPEVVAVLIDLRSNTWVQDYVHRALARIGTPEALDHLAAVGACHQLSDVGDPRAAQIAHTQLRARDHSTQLGAVRLLTRMPDSRWVPELLDAYDRQTGDELRVSILAALAACDASDEVARRAPDLLDGPYGYVAEALLNRVEQQG